MYIKKDFCFPDLAFKNNWEVWNPYVLFVSQDFLFITHKSTFTLRDRSGHEFYVNLRKNLKLALGFQQFQKNFP